MMKIKIISFIFYLMLYTCYCNAQNQVNYWMGGMDAVVKFDESGAHFLHRTDGNLFWRTTASISDSAGNLLFYTNGYRVFNREFQVMQNGDNLNIGDYVNWGYNLMSVNDGAVIIPVPGEKNKYYLFHVDLNDIEPGVSGLWTTHLFYSKVDMDLANGNGAIISNEKNKVVLNDTLTQMGMKAIKHGNGRDWWLICSELGTNRYWKFLIDPNGIHGPYSQNIGIIYTWVNAQASPIKFYTDGEAAARLSRDSNIVELYNFNRCSGELYNYRKFKVNDTSVHLEGICFSPSGRYLYISSNFNQILQFDLTATDIQSTRTVVGDDDGVLNPFPANYCYQEIGADGKIYVSSYDGNYSLSVINHPDSAGLKCNFVQRGFPIDSPSAWFANIPNIPNYSLGALKGSGCDSLSTAQSLPVPVFTYGVYPNPFSEELNISVTGASTDAEIEVYNMLGQQVYANTQIPKDYFVYQRVNLSSLSSGMYFVNLKVNGKQYVQKVVKK